jgi:hypothetical protein
LEVLSGLGFLDAPSRDLEGKIIITTKCLMPQLIKTFEEFPKRKSFWVAETAPHGHITTEGG